jgi:hypothetical protein
VARSLESADAPPLAAELLKAGHESADKHGQLVGELAAVG